MALDNDTARRSRSGESNRAKRQRNIRSFKDTAFKNTPSGTLRVSKWFAFLPNNGEVSHINHKNLIQVGTVHALYVEISIMQQPFLSLARLGGAFPAVLLGIVVLLSSCSNSAGTQVKTPFSGKKYMSDARYFRGVGMGQSANLNIAKSKAELESRKVIAQQVRTNLKVVSDAYASELVGAQASETVEKFASLAREVTNNTIGDIRQLGQEIRQLEDQTYRVHVAVEIKKKAMFRFLKDKARNDAKISELARAQMITMLDKEIERLESEE